MLCNPLPVNNPFEQTRPFKIADVQILYNKEWAQEVLRMKCNIECSLNSNTEEQKWNKMEKNGFTVNKNMKQQKANSSKTGLC